jgi:hypothetical protein
MRSRGFGFRALKVPGWKKQASCGRTISSVSRPVGRLSFVDTGFQPMVVKSKRLPDANARPQDDCPFQTGGSTPGPHKLENGQLSVRSQVQVQSLPPDEYIKR